MAIEIRETTRDQTRADLRIALEACAVRKIFRPARGLGAGGVAVRAVDDVSLTVRRGEIYGLLGANGSGKSTLIRVFSTLLTADAGEVRIFGYDIVRDELAVKRLKVAKERIGFVSSNCWDALGAKSFGFRVYWINRSGAPLDRLGFTPDEQVKSLDEVLR